MANVATELHTHTQNHTSLLHLQTTAHMPHKGNVSNILSLPCSPSLFAPGYIHRCIYIYTGTQRQRAALCLSQTHTSHHIDVCIGAELFTQTQHSHPVYEYGCSHRSIYTVLSLSLSANI